MSEPENKKINVDPIKDRPDVVDSATYPYPLEQDVEARLRNGTATMAEVAYGGLRDAYELRKLGEPEPKTSLNLAEVRQMTLMLNGGDTAATDALPFSESVNGRLIAEHGDGPVPVSTVVKDALEVHKLIEQHRPQRPPSA